MYHDHFLINRELIIYRYLWDLRRLGRTQLRVPRLFGELIRPPTSSTNTPDEYGMVMELLGDSLATLFQKISTDAPCLDALLNWLTADALNEVQRLHETGIVHRDIKPDNLVLKIDATAIDNDDDNDDHDHDGGGVTLIDYGLSSQYIQADGLHVPARTGLSLIGTSRYASIWAHEGALQSRRDDVASLCYSMMLLASGGDLPWVQPMIAAGSDRRARARVALKEKQTFDVGKWGLRCTNAADPPRRSERFAYCARLLVMHQQLCALTYDEKPPYQRWIAMFREGVPSDFDAIATLREICATT